MEPHYHLAFFVLDIYLFYLKKSKVTKYPILRIKPFKATF